MVCSGRALSLDFAVPCIHGSPGEDGRIQAFLELMGLPYLGSGPEASLFAFDKISTKLWAEALGIPTTPFVFVEDTSPQALSRATACWEKWGEVFVKPSRQGSSVGMARVSVRGQIEEKINQAFQYSPTVLIERSIKGRELELAAYQYGGELQVSNPGEILCSEGFYDYRQKYSKDSSARTCVEAKGLESKTVETLKNYSRKIFLGLGCRHLARIDFFVTEREEILLNEINTFPGHTRISMFPLMMENNGHSYRGFLAEKLS